MLSVSVIVCTYNPDPSIFERTLGALKEQTLPMADWEFVIVDNNSTSPLRVEIAQWHPNARVVRESKQGQAYARKLGIKRTSGDIIVFVDDDNILSKDYLANALTIAETQPFLGAVGGAIELDPQVAIPEWYAPYRYLLVERHVAAPRWCNFPEATVAPCGAGLVVRRCVAEAFCIRSTMTGRKGTDLSCGEDTEMAFMSCDLGFAYGSDPRLKLKHVIPSRRLTKPYCKQMLRAMTKSNYLVQNSRGLLRYPPLVSKAAWFARMAVCLLLGKPLWPEWQQLLGLCDALKEL